VSFRRAIHLFPWDAQSEGASASVEAIARLGCNAVVLSPNYHRARLFRPRSPAYYHRPVDWCDFEPTRSLYAEPELLPPTNPDGACVRAGHEAAAAARQSGLELLMSVIGCHNTTIGLARPELCIENAFGDRYSFALCPAQPRVQALLTSLVTDVCRQFRPDSVVLDSFSYLDAVHREHHELMFVSPGAFGKYLLSLCFCPACREGYARQGLDPEAMRSETRRLVAAAVARPPMPRSGEHERDELGALLVEYPAFQAMHQARSEAVGSLLEKVAAAARSCQVRLHAQTGLLARPSAPRMDGGRGTAGAGATLRAPVCPSLLRGGRGGGAGSHLGRHRGAGRAARPRLHGRRGSRRDRSGSGAARHRRTGDRRGRRQFLQLRAPIRRAPRVDPARMGTHPLKTGKSQE
jgi:hypothetical protein